MSSSVAAVLLAGGSGSRFGGAGHKLLAELPGNGPNAPTTVIEHAVANALLAEVGPLVIVTGAIADVVPERFADQVVIRHNEHWAAGQITSVHVGLAAVADLGCDAAVIGLADQPFIDPAAWRRVAATTAPIAVATYDGRRGNPVKLDAEVWDLLPTTGDEGARALMRVRPDLVVEVPCTGSPADIDTEEDLRRWQSS